MRSTVQVLVAVVVALLVVVGVFGIASITFDSGEKSIGKFAENLAGNISCVMANMEGNEQCVGTGSGSGG